LWKGFFGFRGSGLATLREDAQNQTRDEKRLRPKPQCGEEREYVFHANLFPHYE
jgi:hypothetical protein